LEKDVRTVPRSVVLVEDLQESLSRVENLQIQYSLIIEKSLADSWIHETFYKREEDKTELDDRDVSKIPELDLKFLVEVLF
jgi:hypothetical protein